MPQYKFYMKKSTWSEEGWSTGEEVDLEEHFKGLRYKSVNGLRTYGRPKGVYVETYAESDSARVYISPLSLYEQTDITLTLYFFDPLYRETLNDNARQSAIKAAGDVYDAFMEYITGGIINYYDTARQKSVFMYLNDSAEPSVDSLKGVIYIEVPFKFKNIYGRSFDASDKISYVVKDGLLDKAGNPLITVGGMPILLLNK